MELPTFIRLENSLEKAMAYINSPQMTEYVFEGVHLLPNNPFAYIQRTYASEGIEIEEWEVKVKNVCGTTLADISEYFDIIRNFNDTSTGLPQVEWSLKNTPFDFNYQLVYLEINTGANGYIYSSPFILTSHRSEYTSQWFYKDSATDTMLSIGLSLYFRQKKSELQVTNYTGISIGQTFTANTNISAFEKWNTSVIDITILELFKYIFTNRYVYSNYDGILPVRTGLQEAFDTPDLQMDENFAEQVILLIRNYSQTYDPNAVNISPPTPPDAPYITLDSVISTGTSTVKFTFIYGNFLSTPSAFTYQWSLDGVTWNSSTGSVSSPHSVNVENNEINDFYYRVYYYGDGTTSNVVQFPKPLLEITNITTFDTAFNPSGNHYYIYYAYTGFTLTSLTIEYSTDGIVWQGVSYINISNPKQILTPSSSLEFKYFRLRDQTSKTTSPVYFREF